MIPGFLYIVNPANPQHVVGTQQSFVCVYTLAHVGTTRAEFNSKIIISLRALERLRLNDWVH